VRVSRARLGQLVAWQGADQRTCVRMSWIRCKGSSFACAKLLCVRAGEVNQVCSGAAMALLLPSCSNKASPERRVRFGSDMRLDQGDTSVIQTKKGPYYHGGTHSFMAHAYTVIVAHTSCCRGASELLLRRPNARFVHHARPHWSGCSGKTRFTHGQMIDTRHRVHSRALQYGTYGLPQDPAKPRITLCLGSSHRYLTEVCVDPLFACSQKGSWWAEMSPITTCAPDNLNIQRFRPENQDLGVAVCTDATKVRS